MMNKVTKKRRIVKSRWHSNTKKWNVRKRRRSRVISNNKTKRVYTGGGFFSFRNKKVFPTNDVGKSSGWDCTCRFAENSPEVSVSNTGPDVQSENITSLPRAIVAAATAAAASMKISSRPSPPSVPRSSNSRPKLNRLQQSVPGGGAPPEEITKNVICECKKRPVVV